MDILLQVVLVEVAGGMEMITRSHTIMSADYFIVSPWSRSEPSPDAFFVVGGPSRRPIISISVPSQEKFPLALPLLPPSAPRRTMNVNFVTTPQLRGRSESAPSSSCSCSRPIHESLKSRLGPFNHTHPRLSSPFFTFFLLLTHTQRTTHTHTQNFQGCHRHTFFTEFPLLRDLSIPFRLPKTVSLRLEYPWNLLSL